MKDKIKALEKSISELEQEVQRFSANSTARFYSEKSLHRFKEELNYLLYKEECQHTNQNNHS